MFLHYIVQLKNIVFTNLIVIVIIFIIIIFFKRLLIWFIYLFLNFCTHDLENSSCIVTAPQSTEELIFNLCTVLLICFFCWFVLFPKICAYWGKKWSKGLQNIHYKLVSRAGRSMAIYDIYLVFLFFLFFIFKP